MKSTWIEHQGKRIFFADYSGFKSDHEAFHQEVKDAVDLLSKEPSKSVLVLSSFEDTAASIANLNMVRQQIQRANHEVIKRALLGITGTRLVFMTTFRNVLGDTTVAAFETREEALDWLVTK